MEIKKEKFGVLKDGTKIDLYVLKNKNGMTAKITNYGANLTELHVPDRQGSDADVDVYKRQAFAEGETSDMYIEVNGGKLTVDASGDGIDSNGSIKITGGETYISGPTDNGNGSLDYNTTAVIEGGIVIAAGSSGMAQTFSDSSSQNFVTVFLSDTESAETKISLTAVSYTHLDVYKRQLY